MPYRTQSACACTTSERGAAVNNSISFYIVNDIPAMNWLSMQKQDIEHKINRLQRLKVNRANAKKWRQSLNKIANACAGTCLMHYAPLLEQKSRQY